MAGELAPAVGGHLAVLGIETHDDVAAKGAAGVLEEPRVLHSGRADDDVADACVQVAFDRVQITDATAELDGYLVAHLPQDRLDGALVHRLAGKGTVQIHQVQTPCTGVQPAPRHGRGVVAEGGGDAHVSLLKADALAVLQIDGRDQQHGSGQSVVEKRCRETVNRQAPGSGSVGSAGPVQGFQCRKLQYSANPCSALFSGWNWVAKMLSLATAQVKRPP